MKNGRYEKVRNIVEDFGKESKNHNSDFASLKPQLLNLFRNLKKLVRKSAKLIILNLKNTQKQNLVLRLKTFYPKHNLNFLNIFV